MSDIIKVNVTRQIPLSEAQIKLAIQFYLEHRVKFRPDLGEIQLYRDGTASVHRTHDEHLTVIYDI